MSKFVAVSPPVVVCVCWLGAGPCHTAPHWRLCATFPPSILQSAPLVPLTSPPFNHRAMKNSKGHPPIQVIVNGALLTIAPGTGLTLPRGRAHILCTTPRGCIVHLAGLGSRSLSAATAMTIDCEEPGQTLLFDTVVAGDAAPDAATKPRKRSHCLRPGSRPAPATTKASQVEAEAVSAIANGHATRWRACATSFSTMARFLQRFNRDLRWNRPHPAHQTIVHWGAPTV